MLNKVILIGNLGKDPEVKTFDNGNSICNFTLATNEVYKDRNGEKQKRTDWHNIHLWNQNQIKVAQQYLKKGDSVYLEGQIRTREYEKDGQKRYITEIHVDKLQFLPRANKEGVEGTPNQGFESSTQNSTASSEDFIPSVGDNFNDDLPF